MDRISMSLPCPRRNTSSRYGVLAAYAVSVPQPGIIVTTSAGHDSPHADRQHHDGEGRLADAEVAAVRARMSMPNSSITTKVAKISAIQNGSAQHEQ